MAALQRKIKTIFVVLILIYLCLKIYHTSQSILHNEARIALLKKVLTKPLCTAHERIIQRLKRLTKDLTYVRMSVDRDVAMARIIERHYDNLTKLLREIELITSTNANEKHKENFEEKHLEKSKVVCPEAYKGSIHGYPFYRKGFETQECSLQSEMRDLVTLIFDEIVISRTMEDGAKLSDETGCSSRLFYILKSANRLYPGIVMHVMLRKNCSKSFFSKEIKNRTNLSPKILFHYLDDSLKNRGKIIQNIINQVKTDYILIAPSLTHFTEDVNLERLVRVLSTNKQTLFAGGSHRNLTGHWRNGCLQMQLRNYTLSYKTGYFRSFSECLVCGYLSGPFVAKTSVLRKVGLHWMSEHGMYRDLFLRVEEHLEVSRSSHTVVSCPDVMFHSQPPRVRDDQLANFANKHEIRKIVEADGKVRWFGCRRGLKHRKGEKCSFKVGMAVPPCCLENLADAIKFIMEQCIVHRILCELQEGTLLGAVKFNKVLPWERDADIVFLTSDFPKLVEIKHEFTKQGYEVHDVEEPWCCVDGLQAGGKIEIFADGWSIQMYGQHRMSPEGTITYEHHPTKVFFSGRWLNAPVNPGLYIRNRYGREVYKHAEHWMSTGKDSGWDPYETGGFSVCPVKGFHGCLDNYLPDGSVQFENKF